MILLPRYASASSKRAVAFIAGLALAALSFTGAIAPAGEAAPVAAPTLLRITGSQMNVGGNGTITALLTTADGTPISDSTISLQIAGGTKKARTDAQGSATFVITDDLSAGPYDLSANYSGSRRLGYSDSSAQGLLRVAPTVIHIKTAPAVAGMGFSLVPDSNPGANPQTAISKADGIADFAISHPGDYRVRATGIVEESGVKAEFSRWQDNSVDEDEVFTVRPGVRVEAGFEVSYLVSHDFVGPNGASIDAGRVGAVTVTNTLGQKLELPPEATWLVGQRAIRDRDGLEAVEIMYSVESVIVDGSNVVNRSEQRFYPSQVNHWALSLRLFSLEMSASDALFGRATGSTFSLIYPDGHAEEMKFDKGSRTIISGLARGDYKVAVEGAVIAKTVPVSLTRDQTAKITVVTKLDVFFFVGGLAVLAIAIYVFGHSRIWASLPVGGGQAVRPKDAK